MPLNTSQGRINSDVADMIPQEPEELWYYQQIGLGFNYRMADIHAALGLSQMQRLDEFVTKRHIIAKRYEELLAGLPVITPWQHSDSYSGFHLHVIRLKLSGISKTQREVFEALRTEGIDVNLHYIQVYHQPYYEGLGFKVGHCPEAEQYFAEAISLPMFQSIINEQQSRVITALAKVLA